MKNVFIMAAQSAIHDRENFLQKRYHSLLEKKSFAQHMARHNIASRLAVLSYGVLKSGREFNLSYKGGGKIH